MRFQSLHLKCYGAFTDRLLEFDRRTHDFHAIYGANEAGKTTTLRALSSFLFGFEDRRGAAFGDDFLHDKRALRVGAGVERSAGQTLTAYRRKGRVNTLLDGEDGPIADPVLAGMLGGIHRDLFLRLFGLDHVRLRTGGEEILQGGGDVGLTLFGASAGLVGLRRLLDGLRADADAIFRPRGQKASLNAAIKDYGAARARMREAALSGETWRRTYREIEALKSGRESLNQNLEGKQLARTRLERIRRNLRDLVVRREIAARLDDLAAVPELRPSFYTESREARQALEEAQRNGGRAAEESGRIGAALAGITVPADVLAAAEEIEALQADLGRVRAALADLPKCRIEFQAAGARINELLQEAGLQSTAEQAEAALPAPPALARIRALIKKHDALNTDLAGIRRAADEAAEAARSLTEALAKRDVPPDPAPLQAMIGGVGEQGRLEDEAGELRVQLARTTAGIGDSLAALPLWSGTADGLVRLAAPSLKTVDRFEKEMAEAELALRSARMAAAAAETGVEGIERDRQALSAAGRIPSAALVGEARRRRERGWQLIRQAYIDGDGVPPAEAAAFDPSRPLPQSYEHSVAAADALADEMYTEAERVARFQALEADHQRSVQHRDEAVEAEAEACQRRNDVEARWRREWAALGRDPLPPQEMAVWLRDRSEIAARLEEQRQQQQRIGLLTERIEAARRGLGAALQATGAPAAGGAEPLASLVQRGKIALERIAAERLEHVRLGDRLDEANRTAGRERERAVRVETELRQWREDWGQAVAILGRPKEATAEEVEAVLALIGEMRTLLVKWTDLRDQRIAAMETHIDGFEARVRAATARCAPDLADEPATDAVRQLCARLRGGRTLNDRRLQLESDLAREQEARNAATAAAEAASAKLEHLCREAGCARIEDLERTEKLALEKIAAMSELEEAAARLLEQNPGLDVQQIEAEAEKEDPDSLPGRSETLDQEIAVLSAERDRLAYQIGEATNQLAGMDGGDAAARAAQDAEAHLARIREDARRCLSYRVAAALLTRAVAEYRDSNQGPLLARAASLFSSLTCASFEGLATDVDGGGQPVLTAIRANGRHLTVDALSDGSRDQLYLAIRLAAIEAYLANNEPMPLVLDDILINFDDERAAATLRVLYDLSQRMQVLFFTHHTHLIELMRRTLGDGAAAVLALDS